MRTIQVAFVCIAAVLTVSPAQARFLQTDPSGSKDDLNLYGYVGNDPANKTDPTGKWKCTTCDQHQLGEFNTSQSNAEQALGGKIAVLTSLLAKLRSGAQLSPTEKAAAATVSTYLGKGAGSNPIAVGQLLEYANT